MLGTCTVTEEIAYHSSSMAGVYDGIALTALGCVAAHPFRSQI
jgi:hypothetical protein